MLRSEILVGRVLSYAANTSQAYLHRYESIEKRSAVVNDGSGE